MYTEYIAKLIDKDFETKRTAYLKAAVDDLPAAELKKLGDEYKTSYLAKNEFAKADLTLSQHGDITKGDDAPKAIPQNVPENNK